MIALDDPRHGRLRNIVRSAFTPKVVSRIEESVRDRARRLVSDLIANHPDGQGELVSEPCPPRDRGVLQGTAKPDPRHRSHRGARDAVVGVHPRHQAPSGQLSNAGVTPARAGYRRTGADWTAFRPFLGVVIDRQLVFAVWAGEPGPAPDGQPRRPPDLPRPTVLPVPLPTERPVPTDAGTTRCRS